MSQWLRRIRAILVMGVIWAIGGIGVGGLIELVDNVLPAAHGFTRLVDMWPQTLAILAFPHGVVFAILLGVLRGHRRFEELSLPQFAAWGALAGVALGAVAMALGAGIGFVAMTTLLSAVGGATSLQVARMAERRGLLGAAAPDARTELADGRTRELLGRRD